MNDYWFTDEYGRKRHVGGDSSERYSVATKHDYYTINSLFSSYSKYFSRSRLHSTHCPICSADVFFCECDNGGRVFFDTLAPTWKKHPCTTSYESVNRVKTYRLIHPKENHYIKKGEKTSKKTVMEVPDFMDKFELNLKNGKAYDNLINNCTVLVREENGKLLLTIIVNNKNFNNEYLCNDKKFNNQRDLEIFLESILWDTDLSVSLKIRKKENKIKTVGDHKIIQINPQNIPKVLTKLTIQQKKLGKQKYADDKQRKDQRETEYKERPERRKLREETRQNRQKLHQNQKTSKPVENVGERKSDPTMPKREGLTIVKKKNAPDKPIESVASPIESSKMILDQFRSKKESLSAIREKIQKQLDERI